VISERDSESSSAERRASMAPSLAYDPVSYMMSSPEKADSSHNGGNHGLVSHNNSDEAVLRTHAPPVDSSLPPSGSSSEATPPKPYLGASTLHSPALSAEANTPPSSTLLPLRVPFDHPSPAIPSRGLLAAAANNTSSLSLDSSVSADEAAGLSASTRDAATSLEAAQSVFAHRRLSLVVTSTSGSHIDLVQPSSAAAARASNSSAVSVTHSEISPNTVKRETSDGGSSVLRSDTTQGSPSLTSSGVHESLYADKVGAWNSVIECGLSAQLALQVWNDLSAPAQRVVPASESSSSISGRASDTFSGSALGSGSVRGSGTHSTMVTVPGEAQPPLVPVFVGEPRDMQTDSILSPSSSVSSLPSPASRLASVNVRSSVTSATGTASIGSVDSSAGLFRKLSIVTVAGMERLVRTDMLPNTAQPAGADTMTDAAGAMITDSVPTSASASSADVDSLAPMVISQGHSSTAQSSAAAAAGTAASLSSVDLAPQAAVAALNAAAVIAGVAGASTAFASDTLSVGALASPVGATSDTSDSMHVDSAPHPMTTVAAGAQAMTGVKQEPVTAGFGSGLVVSPTQTAPAFGLFSSMGALLSSTVHSADSSTRGSVISNVSSMSAASSHSGSGGSNRLSGTSVLSGAVTGSTTGSSNRSSNTSKVDIASAITSALAENGRVYRLHVEFFGKVTDLYVVCLISAALCVLCLLDGLLIAVSVCTLHTGCRGPGQARAVQRYMGGGCVVHDHSTPARAVKSCFRLC